ncbi:transcriptional regulator [Paenibacillus sp. CCS19]|uniref:helix-turn-helix transcriptional regulator n=1 Tax=Paenibacillus sp. CCS19 TaxID=3158387 RepID=UPI0025647687|nr:metalloregulator ArsR/SmtB family transcription factor [Paenibacillus cellulosilyticus]GMK39668.1 transcriptional regulator [Paenibacillus cellulosilyticus]
MDQSKSRDDREHPSLRSAQSTRRTVLELLKTRGVQSAGELAVSLGLTEMAIRRHLYALESDGFIHQTSVKRGAGRPKHMYALTEESEVLFPKNYHGLTLEILDELSADEQTAPLVDKLFQSRKHKLIARYSPRMAGKTLDGRVHELAAIQHAGGYMVEVERIQSDSYRLHEYNCPIAQVAKPYQQACACELQLFAELLQAKVERTECLAKGGAKCTYAIQASAAGTHL